MINLLNSWIFANLDSCYHLPKLILSAKIKRQKNFKTLKLVGNRLWICAGTGFSNKYNFREVILNPPLVNNIQSRPTMSTIFFNKHILLFLLLYICSTNPKDSYWLPNQLPFRAKKIAPIDMGVGRSTCCHKS